MGDRLAGFLAPQPQHHHGAHKSIPGGSFADFKDGGDCFQTQAQRVLQLHNHAFAGRELVECGFNVAPALEGRFAAFCLQKAYAGIGDGPVDPDI